MSSLFGIFQRRSSLENPTYPLTSQALIDYLGGPASSAGVTVTPTTALKMSAAYRAISLISGVSAALPLHPYKQGTRDRARSMILENPHPELTPLEFWRLTYVHRGMHGNSYSQKIRNNAGALTWLYPIHPDRVKVGRVKYSAANPAGKIFKVRDDDGQEHVLTSEDIFHLPALGYDGVTGCSPLRMAQQAIGLGLAAEEYGARLFGSGSLMTGILQVEQRLEQEQAEALQSRWEAKTKGLAKAHKTVVLDSGAKWQNVTMPNTDAQFLESRAFSIAEVARFFGVPAFLMGLTEKSTSWGTGLEQQATGWVVFDLGPQWLAPTEQRITKELTPPSVYAKYAVQGLLRGDSTARAAFYRVMREVGAFSANDILELEDRPGIGPDGDTRLQPKNMDPLGTEAAGDQNSTPPPDQNQDDGGDDG